VIDLARRVAFSVLIVLAVAVPASAQGSEGPAIEVGYQYMRAPDLSFPLGFNVGVSGPISGPIGVAGEVGWTRHSENGATATATNFGAGVRLTAKVDQTSSAARVFGQVLVGAEHDSVSVGSLPIPSETDFMLQAGGGVSAPFGSNGMSFQFQADWRRVFYTGAGENHFRFVVGVAIPFNR